MLDQQGCRTLGLRETGVSTSGREAEDGSVSLDAELACLTTTQLTAVLDCLQAEMIHAKTSAERSFAQMGFAVVRAELLSREFCD